MENINNIDKIMNDIDNILNKIDNKIDNDEDILGIADYFFGDVLYNMTTVDLIIKEHTDYTVAITWLCDRGYEKECKMYAYILNHYYPGTFDKMMNDLIEKEEYEKCASLQKYKNITKIN